MKKLIMTASLVCVALYGAWAQPDDKKKEETVEIEISGNKVIIEADDLEDLSEVDLNTIIREVTLRSIQIQKQQEELIAQVNQQEANGEITAEQAEEMRDMINEHTEESMEMVGELMEAWGESYEDRMEAWGDEYEASMEAWEDEVEARADAGNFVMPPLPPIPPLPPAGAPAPEAKEKGQKIIINEEGIIIQKGDDGEEPFAWKFDEEEDEEEPSDNPKSIDRTTGYFDINWGFNQQLEGGSSFITDGPEELDFWRSHVFDFGFGGKTRLGSPFSKLYVKWGAEFSFNGFRLLENNSLQKDANGNTVIQVDSGKAVDKSKYNIAYFSVPVMLQFDFSEVGQTDESFTIGLGGYAGVRLSSKRVLKYSTPQYSEVKENINGDFNTNQFRYGVMAQVGWDAFKITAKYDLNSFFKEGKGPDYQVASITLGFTL